MTGNVGYLNVESGTATSGSTTVINDTTKSWTANQFFYAEIFITAGTGAGQRSIIKQGGTSTQLPFATPFITALDNTSKYIIVPYITSKTYRPTAVTAGTKTSFLHYSGNPFTLKLRKYGLSYQNFTLQASSAVTASYTLTTNPFVVASEATAFAYTGISINGSAKTIDVTTNHTVQEIYDYTQAWAVQSVNMQYTEPMTTADGSTFTLGSGWSLTANGYINFGTQRIGGGTIVFVSAGTHSTQVATTTINMTAVGAYDFGLSDISGTVTLTNTSGSPITVRLPLGTSYVNSGPNVTVSLSTPVQVRMPNLIDGTRVQLYNLDTLTIIDSSIVSGGAGYVYNHDYTADINIRLRATYVSGVTAKNPIETFSVITSAGSIATNLQYNDTVYINNGIDGSTITEYTLDGINLLFEVDDLDGETTVQRGYAWYSYQLYTSAGIHVAFGAMTAVDEINYRLNVDVLNFYFKNISLVACRISGGYIFKSDDSSLIDPTSNSIFLDPGKAYIAGSISSDITAIKAKTDAISNPWNADLASNNTAGTFGERIQKLLTVAKFLGLK